MLLACVLGATAATFGIAVAAILVLPGARAHAVTLLALTVPLQSLAVLATVHARLRRAGTGWRQLGFQRPTMNLLHLLWQIPVLIVGLLMVQGLTFTLVGHASTAEGDGIDGIDGLAAGVGPAAVLALGVGVVVLAPLWEEAVFRGVIHGGLRRRWPVGAVLPVAAACFAGAHGVPLLLPYLLTLGVGLGVLREVHRSLWAPVIAHATVNALASVTLLEALLG